MQVTVNNTLSGISLLQSDERQERAKIFGYELNTFSQVYVRHVDCHHGPRLAGANVERDVVAASTAAKYEKITEKLFVCFLNFVPKCILGGVQAEVVGRDRQRTFAAAA